MFLKMRKLLITLIGLLHFMNAVGQNSGLSNNWLMGYQSLAGPPGGQTRINFFNGTPVITYDSIDMDFNHTHANISDTAGNMLFYTNGHDIADATDQIMQNGFGLNPGAYANAFPDGFLIPQGALIIRKPDTYNIYYLFHHTLDNYPGTGSYSYHFYVTTIDMNLNGGLGAVVSKNISLINDTMNVGKITACKHGNGRDWWVIVHRVNSDKYYKLLVTPYGIQGPFSQNIGLYRMWDAGQAKFSPDGKRFAYYHYFNGLDVYDFDRCTGLFSNARTDTSLPWIVGNVGCAFSANSNVLYVGNILKVYQYDCNATTLLAGRTEVATYDSFVDPQNFLGTYLCYPELAPDGKIYITTGNSTQFMHVINNPDTLGLNCNVAQHGIYLPSLYFNTLPNHPNYFLGRDTGSVCDTVTWWLGEQSHPPPETKIKVLSNPNDGRFTFWFPVNKDAGWLEIYNINGKVICKLPVAQWSQYKQVDITGQPAGVYFCRMWWSDKSAGNVKVIKE